MGRHRCGRPSLGPARQRSNSRPTRCTTPSSGYSSPRFEPGRARAGHSTPLGASDEAAGTAERLQFTAGAGPCMFAAESGWPVFGPEDQLRTRWPAFHDLLVTHTPFRSVVALSLPGELRGHGALDLYLTHPVGVMAFDAVDALCVAELISDQL